MATYAINAISTYQFILKKMKRKDIPQIAQCNLGFQRFLEQLNTVNKGAEE